MANYDIPVTPVYDGAIRKLENTDKASATDVFNPLFQKIINNVAAVKDGLDNTTSDVLLLEHIDDKDNPHEVTATQVGADPAGAAASAVSSHNSTGRHVPTGGSAGQFLQQDNTWQSVKQVPAGGSAGQFLQQDSTWQTVRQVPTGGSSGQFLRQDSTWQTVQSGTDIAYVTSETDMGTKNLHVGSIVLMQV